MEHRTAPSDVEFCDKAEPYLEIMSINLSDKGFYLSDYDI